MKVQVQATVTLELELPEQLDAMLVVEDGVVTPAEAFEGALDLFTAAVTDRLHPQLVSVLSTEWSTVCRVCGCTEDEGCIEGCFWVEPDLCSSCVEKAVRA